MKIAIVGGNSQVGTELAFLYRADGHDVRPIVRSDRSRWFLAHHGFDCPIADVTDPDDAQKVLSNADLVIIAAFAGQSDRQGFRPKAARRTNERLVRNCVSYSDSDATVAYLSTIHAYGREVGPNRWTAYGVEKRNAEKTLLEVAKDDATEAYPLRLGQVFGLNQGKTKKLMGPIVRGTHEAVEVDPERLSNIVHTVTIKDATYALAKRSPEQQRYTVVNNPQWTWREVYEFHLPSKKSVVFKPSDPDSRSIPNRLLGTIIKLSRPYQDVLRNALLYTPDFVNIRLAQHSRRSKVADRIASLEGRSVFHSHEFDYSPAPGPQLSGLSETHDLLDEYEPISDPFMPTKVAWQDH